MTQTGTAQHLAGVVNLVDNCMAVSEGDRVLIISEPPEQEFYHPAIAENIKTYLQYRGATVSIVFPRIVADPRHFPQNISTLMGRTEHTLFLSRLGDYARFTPLMGNSKITISYARQLHMLDSPYSGTSHQLMSTLLHKLEGELENAATWRITCPLGTDLHGTFCWPSREGGIDDDFSMNLFPVTTFKPVPCNTAQGTVALSRWLTPGAAAKVDPANVYFDDVVFAKVNNGKLTGLQGENKSIQKINQYCDLVSSTLGIDCNRMHSWHAGINPFTSFSDDVNSHLEAWGAITFASPRYLHFHTSGDVPPGEIAWSIFNPTVWVDGELYWDSGNFCWLQREDNAALIENTCPGSGLFENSADIGV